MNWDALGAIAELLGALAVVLTLVYLALQIRQNTVSMHVAAQQEMTRQYSDFVDLLLTQDSIYELHRKGRRGEALSEEESYKYFLLLNKATWYFSSMHFQYQTHNLSEEEWVQSKRVIERYCAMPGYMRHWEENRGYFPQEFSDYVNKIIEKAA